MAYVTVLMCWIALPKPVVACTPSESGPELRSVQSGADTAVTVLGDTQVAVRLTSPLTSRTEPKYDLFVTVNDIVAANQVIIPRGTPVVFGGVRRAARRRITPGELNLELQGVYTKGGNIVLPLSGALRKEGRGQATTPFTVLMLWMKGEEVTVPAGTLLMASVPKNIVLEKRRITHLHQELLAPMSIYAPSGLARLHLYAMRRSRFVVLDERPIGTLGTNRYACWSLTPGLHVVRLGESQLKIDAQASSEYYVQLSEPFLGPLRQTEGYLFGNALMTPTTGLAGQIPCW